MNDRETKKKLKRELKARRRVQNLITSIRQAAQRGDHTYEEKTRIQLEEYLDKLRKDDGMGDVVVVVDQDGIICSNSHFVNNNGEKLYQCYDSHLESALSKRAKAFVIEIRGEVLQTCEYRPKDESTKERARDLLGHMTKGSQTISMFNDQKALVGYVIFFLTQFVTLLLIY